MAKVLVLKGALEGKIIDVRVTNAGYIVKDSGDGVYSCFIPEDCAMRLSDKICEYQIKIFNLTTLRKNGFDFDNGSLVYNRNGLKMSLSGRWLNKIDETLDVISESDNDIVVKVYDMYYVIPKALRKIMYKHI